MITKENELEKTCSFYVSDYHLEMILVPYINRKIEEEIQIEIISDKNLKTSVEKLIDKINIDKQRKKEILDLNWGERKEVNKIERAENNKKKIVIINGSEKYINKVNEEIEKKEDTQILGIVNCYNLEEVGEHIGEIKRQHKNILNTIRLKEQE